MLALSRQMFSDFSWPLEDIKSHQQHNIYVETETSGSGLGSPSSQPQVGNSELKHNIDSNNDGKMVKKLNHNASERDRRKRINELYSSLRSLLPATDHTKKLSIPATISRMLKYIPELQKEVEGLLRKKEALNVKMARVEGYAHFGNKKQAETQSSSLVVSASRLGDRDIVIQISMMKSTTETFAEALLNLEQEGLLLLNMSSFESFEGWVFYNLHLQMVHGTQVMDLEKLKEKLLSFYENRELQ